MDYDITHHGFLNPPKHWNPDSEVNEGSYAED